MSAEVIAFPDRRQHLRFPADKMVLFAHAECDLGAYAIENLTGLNFSSAGMAFFSAIEIPRSTRLWMTIVYSGQIVQAVDARIRHSVQVPQGWRLGVEFCSDQCSGTLMTLERIHRLMMSHLTLTAVPADDCQKPPSTPHLTRVEL